MASMALSVIGVTQLGPLPEKSTLHCFTAQYYAYRAAEIRAWLPAVQSSVAASVVTSLAFSSEWTFMDVAHSLPGIENTTNIVALSRSLVLRGYTVSLTQVEEMIEIAERSDSQNTHLCTRDCWINCFFVDTGESRAPIAVLDVSHGRRGWYARISKLDSEESWEVENRFHIGNLNISKL
ncbi:MAG: hypothetical protein RLZZ26_59 [Candidatus Parcubacteria bacterium]|jgi:hypothetical protein